MKPERPFIAQRALARHCPELLRAAPQPEELLPQLAPVGERLARGFASQLAVLLGGEAPAVRAEAPRECDAAELVRVTAPLAANSLLALAGSDARILTSMEAEAVLRFVDRAFGGRGAAPSPLPEAFPLSAELMIARLEGFACTALAQALGLPADAVSSLARAGAIGEVSPYGATSRLAVVDLHVIEADGASWTATFAFPMALVARLFGEHSPPPRVIDRRGRHPADEPFGDMPLTISAVLVDMRMAFSALAELRPGQIIPVAVARTVPLRVGDRTIAHGAVGALDDRVAIQVTQAF